jgi:hypothetical protein
MLIIFNSFLGNTKPRRTIHLLALPNWVTLVDCPHTNSSSLPQTFLTNHLNRLWRKAGGKVAVLRPTSCRCPPVPNHTSQSPSSKLVRLSRLCMQPRALNSLKLGNVAKECNSPTTYFGTSYMHLDNHVLTERSVTGVATARFPMATISSVYFLPGTVANTTVLKVLCVQN